MKNVTIFLCLLISLTSAVVIDVKVEIQCLRSAKPDFNGTLAIWEEDGGFLDPDDKISKTVYFAGQPGSNPPKANIDVFSDDVDDGIVAKFNWVPYIDKDDKLEPYLMIKHNCFSTEYQNTRVLLEPCCDIMNRDDCKYIHTINLW